MSLYIVFEKAEQSREFASFVPWRLDAAESSDFPSLGASIKSLKLHDNQIMIYIN